MIEVTRERRVNASAEELWPLVSEPSRLAEWFTFAESAEVLDGEGLGRRQRLHGHWGKKRSEVDQVVTEWSPPTGLAWRHEGERLDGKPAPRFASSTELSITLEPSECGYSRVRLRSRQEPASVLRGVVIRTFGRREVTKQIEASLERLASAVASGNG